MTQFSEQSFDQSRRGQHAEPLPEEFSADLLRIDALIARQAAADQQQMLRVTGEMNERVFAASASLLPLRHGRAPHRKPVVAEAHSLRFVLWGMTHTTRGRLAMAASVAIAFGITVMVLNGPAQKGGGAKLVTKAPARAPGSPRNAGATRMAARGDASPFAEADADLLPSVTADDVERQVAYLLDSDGLRTLDDVRSEMTFLASLDIE